jgi:hypothetical protein
MLTDTKTLSLRDYIEDAYGTDVFEIVGACALLWSGREGDTKAALVRLPDGRPIWGMVEGVSVPPDRIAITLHQRITAYRQATAETEALLMIAGRCDDGQGTRPRRPRAESLDADVAHLSFPEGGRREARLETTLRRRMV